jgi:hypothetical protein
MGVPSVDWEAESYPAYADFAALPFFVAFFLAVRFLLDRFPFEVVTLYNGLSPPAPLSFELFFGCRTPPDHFVTNLPITLLHLSACPLLIVQINLKKYYL